MTELICQWNLCLLSINLGEEACAGVTWLHFHRCRSQWDRTSKRHLNTGVTPPGVSGELQTLSNMRVMKDND